MRQFLMASSLLILAVLLLRRLSRGRISPKVTYALWLLVAFRLLLPGSLGQSPMSAGAWLMHPQRAEIQLEPMQAQPSVSAASQESAAKQTKGSSQLPQWEEADNPDSFGLSLWPVIWLTGGGITAGTLLVSYGQFTRRLRKNRRFWGREGRLPVYLTAGLRSPCLAGWLRPAIYLPVEICQDEQGMRYAIAHESTHYRHGDLVWAGLRCLLLIVHWYHPLVWLAAYYSKVDGELACDADTVTQLGEKNRWQYGRTLIDWTAGSGFSSRLTPGGSGYLKERIEMLRKKPKNRLWMILLLAFALLFTGACTFTQPPEERSSALEPAGQQAQQTDAHKSDGDKKFAYIGGETDLMPQDQYLSMMAQILKKKLSEDYISEMSRYVETQPFVQAKVYDVAEKNGKLEVTMQLDFDTFVVYKEEVYCYGAGGNFPIVATLSKDGEALTLEDIWYPEDGSYYDKSLKEKLSPALYKKVIKDVGVDHDNLTKLAEAYFGHPRSKNEISIEENGEYQVYSIQEGTKDGAYYFHTKTMESGTLEPRATE